MNHCEIETIATALVVSPDETTATIINNILRSSAIASITCPDRDTCYEILQQNRFEAAFVDFGSAENAIPTIRLSRSSRSAVLFAITHSPTESSRAFEAGVHFVIDQPTSASAIESIFRAAYGLIIRERRRQFRCPTKLPVIGAPATNSPWSGQILNLSEGGMCISCPAPLARGEELELAFKLPGSSVPILVVCEVQWGRDDGIAGLQFVRIHHNRKPDLLHWLAEQFDKQLNSAVASKAKMSTDAGAVPRLTKKSYETPRVRKYDSLDHVPTKLRAVAETILNEHPALRVIFDEQHRSVSISEELAQLLGYSSRELIGKPIEEVTADGTMDLDFVFTSLRRLKKSKGLWLFEAKAGSKLLCSYEAVLLSDKAIAEFKPLLLAE